MPRRGGEDVQLVVRRVAGEVGPQAAVPGRVGRVDEDHRRRERTARSSASSRAAARTGRGRRRRRPCTEPPGRAWRTEVELAHAGAHEPRHLLGQQAAAGHQQPRRRAGSAAVGSRSSKPTSRPRGEPAERTPVRPGRSSRRRQERRGSRVSSTARPKVQGTLRQRGDEVGADLGVDLEVAVEEAEGDPGRTASRGSPRPSPTSRVSSPPVVRPGVVEPQHDEDRQRRSRGRRRRRRAGSGDIPSGVAEEQTVGTALLRAGDVTRVEDGRPRGAPGSCGHRRSGGTPGAGAALEPRRLSGRGHDGGMDNTLLFDARARVLADLAARDHASPAAVSALEDAVEQRKWWAEQWPEGAQYVAGLVAQDVQDALFETRRPVAGLPRLRRPRPRARALHPARPRWPGPRVGLRGERRRRRAPRWALDA